MPALAFVCVTQAESTNRQPILIDKMQLLNLVFIASSLAVICLAPGAQSDVSQLVRSGNGFVYDVPKVSELELEVNNEFPTGEEFPQDAIPVAPSDAELGNAEPEEIVVDSASESLPKSTSSSSTHGYKYQVPSKRFKS